MSAEFTLYSTTGEKVGTVEQPALFSVPVNQKLIHRYFLWVRVMLRDTLAHTKTRGEVSGGGRKPWKQKGTGRARSGSNRNPIWRHGGTIFGPRKEQTYTARMPKTERRLAMFSALASKAQANQVMILNEWAPEAPKTKDAVALLANLKISDKKVLYINRTFETATFRSISNLPRTKAVTLSQLNIIDLLNHDVLLLDKQGLADLEHHFSPTV